MQIVSPFTIHRSPLYKTLPQTNADHRTPLHLAVALSKDYNVSRVLLENGGDLHNRNADGKTPLHTFPSQVSEQILRCHGCLLDLSTRDHRGMSLLHYLAWSSKTSKETFRRYHERSSLDLRTIDAEGRSMLHLAAQRGNVPVVEYLICAAKDFDMNQRDSRGRTVLHYAVENKRACDTLTALISHGADIWARDCHKQSALHHAAKLGNMPAVRALLALGMVDELHAVDCFGMTPWKLAAYHKTQEVLTFLEEMESRLESGPGLVGYRDPSAPTQTRHDVLPMSPRQDFHWFDGGWRSLSRMVQHHQYRLSDLKAYYSVLTCLAILVATWTLVAFRPRILGPNFNI